MKKITLILIITLSMSFMLYAETSQFNLEFPQTTVSSKIPCIIIAPGSGYHKDRPIITDLAKQSNEAGFASLRFNWTPKLKNMPDSLYPQSQFDDVNKMIDLAKKSSQIDTSQIFLAGKSLGSVLAYQTALERKDIKGLILITPIFPTEDYAEQLYPNFLTQQIPILVVVGDEDQDNTQLPVLYRAASQARIMVDVVVVGGDHGLNIDDYQTEPGQKKNMRNINVANQNVINWMLRQLGR